MDHPVAFTYDQSSPDSGQFSGSVFLRHPGSPDGCFQFSHQLVAAGSSLLVDMRTLPSQHPGYITHEIDLCKPLKSTFQKFFHTLFEAQPRLWTSSSINACNVTILFPSSKGSKSSVESTAVRGSAESRVSSAPIPEMKRSQRI